VRPIFDNINKRSSKYFSTQGKYSVDEVMVPYFGRHSSKQFIRGKPIRYGFKVKKFILEVSWVHMYVGTVYFTLLFCNFDLK
jgi:hypothetical protein